jgi:cytochrome bd-type quinol oxidase subunit 2
VINTVGPVWEGNQVWFILGGGAIFAAWPPLYAVSFSGFYLAMFVVLAAFIVRPVAFKYRSKRDAPRGGAWDWALFAGGAVPALIFGVAVGNVLLGVPFHLTDTLMPMYDGNSTPSSSAFCAPSRCWRCGVAGDAADAWRGVAWPQGRRRDRQRARAIGTITGIVTMAGYALSGAVAGRRGRGLPSLARGRHRWPVEPADSEVPAPAAGCRPMPSGPGSSWPLSWALSASPWRCVGLRSGARGVDASVVQAGHLRDDLDRWADDVPLHPALDRGSPTARSPCGTAPARTRRCSSCWS